MCGRGRLNLVTAIDCAPRAGCSARLRQRYPPARSGHERPDGCGCWLHREDFTSRFIITGISVSNGTAMAGIGWEAGITAIGAGRLSCGSGGERRVLRLAANIAGDPGRPLRHPSRPRLPHQHNRDQGHHARATGQTEAWTNES
jgi:hypothetical protein